MTSQLTLILIFTMVISFSIRLWAIQEEEFPPQHQPVACSISHIVKGTVRCNLNGDGKSCVADGRYAHVCVDGKMQWEDGHCSAYCMKELCQCCIPTRGRGR